MAAPIRTCVGCRQRAPQASLLRVVAAGSAVEVDPRQVRPGRGAYLHPETACVELAVRRRALPRALRAPVDAAAAGRVLTLHLASAPPV